MVSGTEHFRNVLRHDVKTNSAIVTLRMDGSLYFANARYLEVQIHNRVAGESAVRHDIPHRAAINEIDLARWNRCK